MLLWSYLDMCMCVCTALIFKILTSLVVSKKSTSNQRQPEELRLLYASCWQTVNFRDFI